MNELFDNEKELQKYLAEVVSGKIKNNAKICDVGFDNVFFMQKLIDKNIKFNYYGTDIFDETVEPAKEYINKHKLLNCVVEKLPFQQLTRNDFNVCTCFRLFHHFDKNLTIEFLEKMLKTINYTGVIYLSDSIRDFNNRKDRYSYTPYFYLNEITKLAKKRSIKVKHSENAELNVGELWIMEIKLTKDSCEFALYK